MALLTAYVDSLISVITNDGRNIVGTLRGFDQAINLVLEDCHERVYSGTGVERVPLGLYLVRGDNVALVGEVDENKDEKIDFSSILAEPLKPIQH